MLDGRLHRPPHLYATVRVAILAGILFLSGIGSLIFETLWLRLSGLSFGNSVWAAALILSSFMAGLALGNAIAASSRFRRWRSLVKLILLRRLDFAVRAWPRVWQVASPPPSHCWYPNVMAIPPR